MVFKIDLTLFNNHTLRYKELAFIKITGYVTPVRNGLTKQN